MHSWVAALERYSTVASCVTASSRIGSFFLVHILPILSGLMLCHPARCRSDQIVIDGLALSRREAREAQHCHHLVIFVTAAVLVILICLSVLALVSIVIAWVTE